MQALLYNKFNLDIFLQENWLCDSEESTREYFLSLHTAMEMRLAVAILRLPTSYKNIQQNTKTQDSMERW